MSSRTRHIIGLAIVTGVVGFTVYAVVKYRQDKKAEEESISLEDAEAEVKERRQADVEEFIDEIDESRIITSNMIRNKKSEPIEELSEDDINEIIDDAREFADYNTSFTPSGTGDESLDSVLEGLDDRIPLTELVDMEDRTLRYEPSSVDARNQFIRMELAEWGTGEDAYQTMLKLFDFPFNPTNDGDYDLYTRLIDYRVQFFGFNSRWVKNISYADVILHYARSAAYNVNESVRYWVEYFLEFNEFDHRIPSNEIDDVLAELNNHTYFNRETETFGLFGLTREYMDNALKIADRNIDQNVTYEIEFNEFLKSCM